MTDHSHLDCATLLSSLSDYIDGELSPELCLEIEKHLAGCEDCTVILNTTKRTIDLVHFPPAQNSLPEDVRQRLFKRLNLQDYAKIRSK